MSRFGAVVILTLSLGIGSTTAIVGIVYQVVLKPLPYPDSDRLVRVWGTNPEAGHFRSSVSVPEFREWETKPKHS